MQRSSDIDDIADWKIINEDASVDLKKKILMRYYPVVASSGYPTQAGNFIREALKALLRNLHHKCQMHLALILTSTIIVYP
jgi:hypothetical protein